MNRYLNATIVVETSAGIIRRMDSGSYLISTPNAPRYRRVPTQVARELLDDLDRGCNTDGDVLHHISDAEVLLLRNRTDRRWKCTSNQ